MEDANFDIECFESGGIKFDVKLKPVSAQSDGAKRSSLKSWLQEITKKSNYIVTGACWVTINYYCQNVRRKKNPNFYDIDNIVKPILDGLTGANGIIVDDVIVNRVTVNWIDNSSDDWFDIEVEYPDLLFFEKSELVFIRSSSGWCLPWINRFDNDLFGVSLIKMYFLTWESISNEDQYYDAVLDLPVQDFIYFTKIRDKGFKFIDLSTLF